MPKGRNLIPRCHRPPVFVPDRPLSITIILLVLLHNTTVKMHEDCVRTNIIKIYSYTCVPHTALDNQGTSKDINHVAFLHKRS